MSWTQTCFGLGYMLGPAVGAALYEVGGFMLPFFSVGGLSTLLSISLAVSIPDLDTITSTPSTPSRRNSDEEDPLTRGESGETIAAGEEGEEECESANRPNLRYYTLVFGTGQHNIRTR
jgi:MFS family permease